MFSLAGRTPSYVGEVPAGGRWPRHLIAIGEFLYVANERSHSVVAFRIEPATGIPEPTGDVLETPSPTCILPAGPHVLARGLKLAPVEQVDVAVVGGGIAGMSVAGELSRGGGPRPAWVPQPLFKTAAAETGTRFSQVDRHSPSPAVYVLDDESTCVDGEWGLRIGMPVSGLTWIDPLAGA